MAWTYLTMHITEILIKIFFAKYLNYTYLCVFLSKADWPNLISNYWTTQNMQPDILSGFAIKSNFWTKVKKKLFHILMIQFQKVVSDVNLVLPDLCYGKFKFYQVWGQFGCIDYKCHVGGIYTFGRSCFFLSNFSCRFLNPNYFFLIGIIVFLMYY